MSNNVVRQFQNTNRKTKIATKWHGFAERKNTRLEYRVSRDVDNDQSSQLVDILCIFWISKCVAQVLCTKVS